MIGTVLDFYCMAGFASLQDEANLTFFSDWLPSGQNVAENGSTVYLTRAQTPRCGG